MIGTGKMRESGYESGKFKEIKEFLKHRISTRYCTASQYYQMKRLVLDKLAELNEQYNGSKLIADIVDPDAVTVGKIRIYRTRKSTSAFVAEVPVYYLWPLNLNKEQEGGGEI